MPRISRLKLPSRNWLIFLGIVGSWTTALVYDRYHKKHAQRKWSNYVAHLAQEEIAAKQLQRRICILLAAPPGDSLRVSREHFHEYIKPILVAGALDWEVIEGRNEGEVRAGLAEKIRKLRERQGEERKHKEDDEGVSPEDAVRMVRHGMQIRDWAGVNGDLVIGRHTWKEYIRGLHEGWLGPMDVPVQPEASLPDPALEPSPLPEAGVDPEKKDEEKPAEKPPEEKKPSPTPPYILPSDYSTATPSASLPSELPPSTAVPLPHLLGFLNTPIRMYRFLNQRAIAEHTGASIAALVLASKSRPYTHSPDPALDIPATTTSSSESSPADPSQPFPWEQSLLLSEAEPEWHKSARAANPPGDTRERVWQEDMVIDPRIGDRMRTFELPDGAREQAQQLYETARRAEPSLWEQLRRWAGYASPERKGWEMGFEGDENS